MRYRFAKRQRAAYTSAARATFRCDDENNPMLLWARAWPISTDFEILRVKVITLICIATAHDLDHRAEHDPQIEVEAPVVDIPYVELYTSLYGPGGWRLSARAIDLRATSNARFHALPNSVVCDDFVKVVVVNCRWWSRTDYRHFALEHINQLRQLIDTRAAQPRA